MIPSAVPLNTQPRGDPGSTPVGPGRHVSPVARRDWHVAFVGVAHSVQVSRSVPTTRDATGVLGDESGNSYARNCQPWGWPQRTPPTPGLRCCSQIVAVSPGSQAPNWRGAAVRLAIGRCVGRGSLRFPARTSGQRHPVRSHRRPMTHTTFGRGSHAKSKRRVPPGRLQLRQGSGA
jgi:hypothetical protein